MATIEFLGPCPSFNVLNHTVLCLTLVQLVKMGMLRRDNMVAEKVKKMIKPSNILIKCIRFKYSIPTVLT